MGKELFLLGAGFSVDAGIWTDAKLLDQFCTLQGWGFKPVQAQLRRTYERLSEEKGWSIGIESFLRFLTHVAGSGGQLHSIDDEFYDFIQQQIEADGIPSEDIEHLDVYFPVLDFLRECFASVPLDGYLGAFSRNCRQRGATIATLNFDLCVEMGSVGCGIAVVRGVDRLIPCNGENPTLLCEDHWDGEGELSWDEREGLRLIKLHGSMDWEYRWGHFYSQAPNCASNPALILAMSDKVRRERPFPDLLSEFERRLSEATTVHVIGYSFRDNHIDDRLEIWWRDPNVGRRALTVVDPYRADLANTPFEAPSATGDIAKACPKSAEEYVLHHL